MTFKRILVATDFSGCAEAALGVTTSLARAMGCGREEAARERPAVTSRLSR